MITINLLPKDRRKSSTNWVFNLTVLLVTAALLALSIGGVFVANLYVISLNNRIAKIDQEMESRREVLDLVSQLEEYKKILDEKNQIIDTLVVGRIQWGHKLFDLAQLVPDQVWLEKLQLETIITKEKVDPPRTTSSSRRTTSRPTYREIRTDYLHVYAVTDNLREKSSIIGEFIDRIYQNESFFSDFDSVDFQEGEEQPWLQKDESSPRVWRFRLTLKLRSLSPATTSSTAGGDSNHETT